MTAGSIKRGFILTLKTGSSATIWSDVGLKKENQGAANICELANITLSGNVIFKPRSLVGFHANNDNYLRKLTLGGQRASHLLKLAFLVFVSFLFILLLCLPFL